MTESQSSLRRSERPPLTALQKFGPLALVMAMLAGVVAFVAIKSPVETATESSFLPEPGRGPESLADVARLPPGVETFARAAKNGTADSIDWGERCDETTGKVKMPLWPVPDCFKPFTGDNGGSTAIGVTETTIKVVIFQPQENDPVLKFIYSQIGNNDTTDQTFATFDGFAEIFNTYYELYGRKVELVRYSATGSISDAITATADAETIARDIQPFAVIGGPQLTNAFADTLAKNKVLCIACTSGQPSSWYEERSPYVWDVQKDADQSLVMVAEYLGKRLWNRPAKYAGDESMHDRTRVFGYIHVMSSEESQSLEDRFTDLLRSEYGMSFAAIQTYGLPTELASSGKDIITKMKEAGVTTILFSGDPLGPQTLTQIATDQEYFPEWVIGATTLVDTAVFSRTYDQKQWAHAFGPSSLFTRTKPGLTGPAHLYEWYFGAKPPASGTVPIISGPLQVLFGALQGMGPGVTHELFKIVLFGAPIIPPTVITPQVSFGDRGVFPDPDYAGLDDQTEIWWDAGATGVTETGKEGKGLWRFVEGGKRFLYGDWPEEEPQLFDNSNSILSYDTLPEGAELPEVTPISGPMS